MFVKFLKTIAVDLLKDSSKDKQKLNSRYGLFKSISDGEINWIKSEKI